MLTFIKIITTYQLHEGGHMNKTETQALWRALCACTCEPGVNDPFDCVTVHDPDNRDFSDTCPYYDPAYIALALRPHKAAGSKNMRFFPGKGNGHAPLIITSTIATAHNPIIITTAVQGMRKAKNMDSNKELENVYKRIERMENKHYWENDRLVNWCYALTGIIIGLICILFVLICNIYFRLGVIPDLV